MDRQTDKQNIQDSQLDKTIDIEDLNRKDRQIERLTEPRRQIGKPYKQIRHTDRLTDQTDN